MYQFRNLPSNVVPDDQLWCVYGTHQQMNYSSWGLLEWCTCEADANERLAMMQQDPAFSDLSAVKWQEEDAQYESYTQTAAITKAMEESAVELVLSLGYEWRDGKWRWTPEK